MTNCRTISCVNENGKPSTAKIWKLVIEASLRSSLDMSTCSHLQPGENRSGLVRASDKIELDVLP